MTDSPNSMNWTAVHARLEVIADALGLPYMPKSSGQCGPSTRPSRARSSPSLSGIIRAWIGCSPAMCGR